MRPIADLRHAPLEWLQPKGLEQFFELRAGDTLAGTLRFGSSFGTLATAETADGSWTFKRVGFLNPRITVRVEGAQEDIAIYQPRFWGDGILTFTDGASFHWRPVNFWSTRWVFMSTGGLVAVAFRPGPEHQRFSDLFKNQAIVEIPPDSAAGPRLPLLAILGWYLIILHQQDSSAAVIVTG